MSSKKDKLLKIVSEIRELYPEMNRLICEDIENPEQIIITSDENMRKVVAAAGIDPDLLEELIEESDEIEFDGFDMSDDDDEDKGPLH